jgi:hypothetical protein
MAKDDADIAAEQEIYHRLEALYKVVRAESLPKGMCLNCGSETPGQSFCDVSCREDHERRAQHEHRTKAHHD